MLSFKTCETVTSDQNIQGEKRIKIKWLTQDSDNPTSFHYDYEQRIGESRRLFVKIQLLETEEIQRQVRLISPCPRLVSFEMHMTDLISAFSSILSNVVLERGKAGKMILSKLESDRVNKILQENNEICKSY